MEIKRYYKPKWHNLDQIQVNYDLNERELCKRVEHVLQNPLKRD